MSIEALNLVLSRQVGGASKKAVLLCLANHADVDFATFVGQERIAAQTELNVRTVRRLLAELEEENLISRRTRLRRTGRGRTSDHIALHRTVIAALPRILEPAESPQDQPDTTSGRSSFNRTLSATNRTLSADQPDTTPGEPSENHQKNLEDLPDTTPGRSGGAGENPHLHEFVVVGRVGDREFKACAICRVGPHATDMLGGESA